MITIEFTNLAQFEQGLNSTRHTFTKTRFIVVHVNPLELKFRVTVVATSGIDALLGTNHFPELGTDLVPTFAK